MSDTEVVELVERARALDKAAVSQLITWFEDRRPSAAMRRAQVLDVLDGGSATADGAPDARRDGTLIGLTGTPGSGKSSLLARMAADLLDADEELSIAVLAVDPSSQVSGGALLGDRTRLRVRPDERRLFFRSQASDSDLGGLGPTTFQVCRLLTRLFDCVMIETVGIGQSEGDVRQLADRVYLVLQPLGGDEVQFLKAGIIEVPDAFILNKCDEPAAMTSYHQLRGSMWLARPFDEEEPPIFLTSARTGEGLDALEADLVARIQSPGSSGLREREAYFFGRWVSDEWGRVGRAHLDLERGGAAAYLAAHGGFDGSQSSFGPDLVSSLQ